MSLELAGKGSIAEAQNTGFARWAEYVRGNGAINSCFAQYP